MQWLLSSALIKSVKVYKKYSPLCSNSLLFAFLLNRRHGVLDHSGHKIKDAGRVSF